MRNFQKEVPTASLIPRHWDESEIKRRMTDFIAALSAGKDTTSYFAFLTDNVSVSQEDKSSSPPIDNSSESDTFFSNFEGKKCTYLYTRFINLYKVNAADDYNDLRGNLEFRFRVKEESLAKGHTVIEHTVLLQMARLGDAAGVRWKIVEILWKDNGIDVSDVDLFQLEKPKIGKPDREQSESSQSENSEDICIIHTDAGKIGLCLFKDKAPKAVNNWVSLSKQGFYDNTAFSRVIKGFVIQGGALDGSGDESISIYGNRYFEDEVGRGLYNFNGALCLGNHGPHTNGNQFYIIQNNDSDASILPCLSLPVNVKEAYKEIGGLPELDGRYTVFGQVFEGMDVVEKIANQKTDKHDAPIGEPVKIIRINFESY